MTIAVIQAKDKGNPNNESGRRKEESGKLLNQVSGLDTRVMVLFTEKWRRYSSEGNCGKFSYGHPDL